MAVLNPLMLSFICMCSSLSDGPTILAPVRKPAIMVIIWTIAAFVGLCLQLLG